MRDAVKTISGCVEQMRRSNELTIAQFKDEIRIIQGRMEHAEEMAARDPGTGARTGWSSKLVFGGICPMTRLCVLRL